MLDNQKILDAALSRQDQDLLNTFCKEMFGLSLLELLDFRIKYGDFATTMLLSSRLQQQAARDPMRDAVEELYRDEDFMKGIPNHIKNMVGQALYGKAN